MLEQLSFSLRPATLADVEFVCQVHCATASVADGQKASSGSLEFQQLRVKSRFKPDETQILCAYGRPVGLLVLNWSQTCAYVGQLEILPEWRHRGLGTMIMLGILKEARRRHMAVETHVLKGNGALEFCRRLGFESVGGSETHFLMRAK